MKSHLKLLLIQLCSSFSVSIMLVFMTILIRDNNGSISKLMVCAVLPGIFFSTYFGELIDSGNWKNTFLILCFAEAMLWFRCILPDNDMNIQFYLLTFVACSLNLFIRLLLQTSVVHHLEEKKYLKMNASLNIGKAACFIFAPFLAGTLIEFEYYFACILILFLLEATSFFVIYRGFNAGAVTMDKGKKTEAKNAVYRHPYEAGGFSIGFFMVIIGVIDGAQIYLITAHSGAENLGYGMAGSIWRLAASLSVHLQSILEGNLNEGAIFLNSLLASSESIITQILSSSYFQVLFLFVIIGITSIFLSILSTTIIQKEAKKETAGFYLGAKTLFTQIASIFTLLATGLMKQSLPPAVMYFFSGTLLLVFSGIIFSKKKQK